MVGSVWSSADMVNEPAAFKVAVRDAAPPTREVFGGSEAVASEDPIGQKAVPSEVLDETRQSFCSLDR